MTTPPRCILVFGGTFDPPHRAHTTLPPLVAEALDCDLVLYVPAALNPLKSEQPPTESHHRVAMLVLALADNPDAAICPIELERDGPSFTVDTLESLHRQYGDATKFRLLIGADQALQFHQWKAWQRVIDLAEPVVMLRPPWTESSFRTRLAETFDPVEVDAWMSRLVHVPLLNIDATSLRQRLSQHESVEYGLDDAVAEYIRHEKLYCGQPA